MNAYEKVVDLSYGENPHQRAAYYAQVGARMHVLSMVRQLHGKELSFNNVLDLNAARLLVQEFEVPACAIIKHNNPCGCAVGASAIEAYERAFACDPLSAFGGVICLNRPVDAPARRRARQAVRRGDLRAALHRRGARAILQEKKNLRILEDNERRRLNVAERDIKRVMGGVLVQDRDIDFEDRTEMEVVTERKPSERGVGRDAVRLEGLQARALQRDRALAASLASVGIGAGQMSRVDSVRLAIEKARGRRRRRCRAPRSRQTRSSRSPTAPSSRSRPASPRSSSPAARCATPRSSRPPTRPASRWSSRTAGTSSTRPSEERVRRLPSRSSVANSRVPKSVRVDALLGDLVQDVLVAEPQRRARRPPRPRSGSWPSPPGTTRPLSRPAGRRDPRDRATPRPSPPRGAAPRRRE